MPTGLFTNLGLELKPSFQQIAHKLYGAAAESLDFRQPASLVHINEWVERSTAWEIPGIPGRLDPAAVLIAVNAIHFRDTWMTPFEPEVTSDLPFKIYSRESK